MMTCYKIEVKFIELSVHFVVYFMYIFKKVRGVTTWNLIDSYYYSTIPFIRVVIEKTILNSKYIYRTCFYDVSAKGTLFFNGYRNCQLHSQRISVNVHNRCLASDACEERL